MSTQRRRRRRQAAMSTMPTDDASEGATSTSSCTNRKVAESNDGGDVDSNLLEMLGLSMSELQQLSALSDEGPGAPANSFESTDSHAGSSEDTGSPETRRTSFGSSDKAGDQPQPALVRGERAIAETTSEGAKARRPSFGASVASLACPVILMIAFLAAVAYGVFLFRLDHIPAPEKKMRAHRSSNGTGADRG
ncbi:uncharacterized protein LOC119401851 [Rhipicephalus sanguineus]|uniref:uncharacterized protein LOC119401851 n=1 Tax=Rhipicephalus sanguineus TaxID=34632 RepID=UPI001895EEBB|nr:uncharacterized protein LOC119401851 [Rhipicephalus sanguineus]